MRYVRTDVRRYSIIDFFLQAISSFKENVMPALSNLHSSLCSSDADVHEAEALIDALLEEMEEVVNDVQERKNSEIRTRSENGGANKAYLECQLKDLLKRLGGKNFNMIY
jgi:Glu-tRNA(Gln) amidotransferase subunit E-like FAD-binding protein